ncbi:glutamate--tRNA ligase [Candidatus Falkowbacteria bacterium CG10_big_fil_rev_8_21_14_0_10_44_15]|uniref:Glutamate--tRNA ligase n=1 Tax=Candidatus Falkowbacteria bacterium CG10_big_fil_rev_8_21_14_0_10_44_15 TaxID=1974569 RepID=A0A2H0UYW6_9BACT|nr:MAG: glutamate--tRNA ligase [Candidatus Falkowbacteria bacterium CG10_big_fil_rev_8_21_14_0_10_44_15]
MESYEYVRSNISSFHHHVSYHKNNRQQKRKITMKTDKRASGQKDRIKTRMAPSPTGKLHVGGLRTALYNYLFAKQNKGGEFWLRIEDTDRARFAPGATEEIFAMLKWAGLNWDGEPVVQSKRLEIYQKYAQQLVDSDHAYYCFCTPEELEKRRAEQQAKKQPPRYDGKCRNLSALEVKEKSASNLPRVIRYKVPASKTVEFDDGVYGKIKYNSNDVDDQILLKSDGYPTYHLAVVVDDHEMGITHVLRGEEWLPSTPKHILLYQAFGWQPPVYCHLPNILGQNKKKLSKREGDASVEDFKNKGYLPEALINYIALLGWNPGTEQEIFSLSELVKQFDINKLHKAGAIFDGKKLDNINGQYIRKLKSKEVINFCRPYLTEIYGDALQNYSDEYVASVVTLEQERLKKLSDITASTQFFFTDNLEYDAKLLIWKKSDKTAMSDNLTIIKQKLADMGEWDKPNLEKEILQFIKDKKLTNGEALWPLRVALSGQENSPGPFEIAAILGKQESLRRIKAAVDKL